MQAIFTSTLFSSDVAQCACEVLDAAPTLISYIRIHMRGQRKGLSVPQFRALYKIRTCPAASLSDVAEHLGASLSTTSRVVTALAAKRYVTRGGCAGDRRQLALHITARGRAILDAAHAATQSQMETQIVRLSPQDRAAVRRAMQVLRSLLESDNTAPERTRFAAPLNPQRIRDCGKMSHALGKMNPVPRG